MRLKQLSHCLLAVAIIATPVSAGASPCGWANALPFICSAQTAISPTPITNPAVNTPTGVLGNCAALPYTVPASYVLFLESKRIENPGLISLFIGANSASPPNVNPPPNSTTNYLDSLQEPSQSGEYNRLNYALAPGTQVGLWMHSMGAAAVVGWSFTGCYIPASSYPAAFIANPQTYFAQ